MVDEALSAFNMLGVSSMTDVMVYWRVCVELKMDREEG